MLERRGIDEVARRLDVDMWSVFVELDSAFEQIADGGGRGFGGVGRGERAHLPRKSLPKLTLADFHPPKLHRKRRSDLLEAKAVASEAKNRGLMPRYFASEATTSAPERSCVASEATTGAPEPACVVSGAAATARRDGAIPESPLRCIRSREGALCGQHEGATGARVHESEHRCPKGTLPPYVDPSGRKRARSIADCERPPAP